MTIVALPETEPHAVRPTSLPLQARKKIYAYLGLLIFLLAFGDPNGGLMATSTGFLLKNRLHLQAHELSLFRLVGAIPLYFSGVFGFIRDSFDPWGLKDRGFLALFGAIGACLYVFFAFTPVSILSLMAAILLLTICFQFLSSVLNGLASTLGQQHVMSGRISAFWNAFSALPGLLALVLGGHVSDALEKMDLDVAVRDLFLGGAAMAACVGLYALRRPGEVFDNLGDETSQSAGRLDDIRRLLRHAPVYPALAIWFLWNFAPGSQTPLQFYLQNELHAPDSAWGEFNAIFSGSFIPTFLLYAFICHRFALKHLLFWGTLFAVPQMVPLLFVHSVQGALLAAAPMGLMGGVATAAYLDLIIRSCPPGLQGTMLMIAWGLYFMVSRFGDLLGAQLYESYGGFTVCVAMITLVYAAIIPVLSLVPKRLTATADGQIPGAS